MDSESKKLLEETVQLSRENNDMLRYMKRSVMVSRIMSFLYWAIIVGSAFGAYYFLQPFIDQMLSLYGGAKNNLEDVGGLIDKLKNSLPQ